MAVLAVAETRNIGSAGVTQTVAHDAGTGTNRYVLVIEVINSGTNNIVAATYGSQTLSLVSDATFGAIRLIIWELIAPASGSQTVTLTRQFHLGSQPSFMSVRSFTGVDQTVPRGTPASNSGFVNDVTVSPGTTAALCVDFFAYGVGTAPVPGFGQTQQFVDTSGGFWYCGSTKAGSTASVVMSWTFQFSSSRLFWAIPLLGPTTGATDVFANLVDTTLAASYTAGAASITVASATGLPSTGNFSVRLGNTAKTILTCLSRSGTTLNVIAEANDANAASGDAVVAVILSARTLGLLYQEPVDPVPAPYAVTPTLFRGPTWRLTPLDQTGWSWVNQGVAGVIQANGVVYLASPAAGGAGTNVRARTVAVPATPWTVTALCLLDLATGNYSQAGLCMRESATGKIMSFHAIQNALAVNYYTNPTTFSANPATRTMQPQPATLWLQMGDTGTTLTFAYSLDGFNFRTLLSEARTAHFTTAPNEIGITLDSESAGAAVAISVLSWRVT